MPGLRRGIFAARFRIISLLGRGAMGEVYRADDLRLGQPVALKLLTDLGPKRRDALARFTSGSAAGSHDRTSQCLPCIRHRRGGGLALPVDGIRRRRDARLGARAHRATAPEKASMSPASCAPVLPLPTNMGSCIATSNRRTSCSMVAAASASWILALRCRPANASIGSLALPPISLQNSWRARSRRNARTCFRLAW